MILAAGSVAISSVTALPESLTLLCKGEQNIGFSWRSGAWTPSRYKPNDYVVTKSANNYCASPSGDMVKVSNDLYFKKVCINIRNLEDKYTPYLSTVCSEYYVFEKGAWDRSFSCEGGMVSFAGNVDGEFHRSSNNINVSAKPENDYKDSLSLEVGVCKEL